MRGGGAERISVNLANELDARGYCVDMVLLRAEGALLPLLAPGIGVVDLAVPRIRGLLFPLVRYLNDFRPQAFLACMWPLTVVSVVARALSTAKPRLVLAEHTTWSASEIAGSRWRLRLVGATMRLAFPFADARVAVSQGAADDLAGIAALPRSSITVLYNPVVGKSIEGRNEQARSAQAWWRSPDRRILAVGTLRADKDFRTLLRAFALVCKEVDARLLILGEGAQRQSLMALSKDLDIAHRIDMPGFVDQTASYYERADLYVLSSIAEGLPTVVIEALAAGARIVSTDCPSGPREILMGGKFGRLVPVGDVDALARAMVDALADEPDRAALMVRAQDFSVAKATDAYERVLFGSEVLPPNGRAVSLESFE